MVFRLAQTAVLVLVATTSTLLLWDASVLALEVDSSVDTATEPPTLDLTLPVIEITLPKGVSKHDEDFGDVVASLIEENNHNNKDTTNPPSQRPPPPPTAEPTVEPTSAATWYEPPPLEEPSVQTATFRQEFRLANAREWTDLQVEFLQDLYELSTIFYAPDVDPHPSPHDTGHFHSETAQQPVHLRETIRTVCNVQTQSLDGGGGGRKLRGNPHKETGSGGPPHRLGGTRTVDGKDRRNVLRTLQHDPEDDDEAVAVAPPSILTVDFTMNYQSMYYDVKDYPLRFQNWTAHNPDMLLTMLNVRKLEVWNVTTPVILSSSHPWPVSSSSVPTLPPTSPTTNFPILSVASGGDIPNRFSASTVILGSLSLAMAFAILFVGVSVYRNKRSNACDDEDEEDSVHSDAAQLSASCREGSVSASADRTFFGATRLDRTYNNKSWWDSDDSTTQAGTISTSGTTELG